MLRPGHHRPLGTTTWMRFPEWPARSRLPALGDVAVQASAANAGDEDFVRRAYLVVGIEEGRSPLSFRLLLERVEYGTLPASSKAVALWAFHNRSR